LNPSRTTSTRRFGCLAVTGLLLVTVLLSVLVTLWVARTWLFPPPLEPVVLDAREQTELDAKLRDLSIASLPTANDGTTGNGVDTDANTLQPQAYTERPQDRVIHFTQRELNALVARNPDLAERLALHLSDDRLSATLLITLPPDLPILAGQTVKVATGLQLRHAQGRPIVSVEGVSIMGVPLPSAWLGGIKGRDLVALHGSDGGFWQAFGEGVRDLRIEQGRLRVELAD
jgi:hypothetical protein